MRKQFRQGDVFLLPVEKQEVTGEQEVKRDGKRVVLAYGEVTGHAHAIHNPGATLYAVNENLRILRIEEKATLQHEEHGPIQLPSGDYQVIQQRENTPLGWRVVSD